MQNLKENPYQSPVEVFINYELSVDCRRLIEALPDCSIVKVVEIISCKVLAFWVNCPKELEKEVSDIAFMTFIKNPVFQRRYQGTKAFDVIAERYIASQCEGGK